MWKTVLAGTTALAIAGGAIAYAQQGPGPRGPHWHPSAEDISAFADARIAALHAGLKLTAEQEKNWPALESALHDLAKQRQERFAARAKAEPPANPIERLNLAADTMSARAAALKKVAETGAPLYNSLDDAQKNRFMVLARMLRSQGQGGEHERRGPGGFGPGWHHPPMGPEGGPGLPMRPEGGPRGPMGPDGGPRL